ncbi:unnamed protein product, partial [Coregonus sp. 'balchen']
MATSITNVKLALLYKHCLFVNCGKEHIIIPATTLHVLEFPEIVAVGEDGRIMLFRADQEGVLHTI